ncbi:hypothetical protein N0V93_002444 [Gnomoniopsis smithogilvyi]|uniref:VWFA domain-containing protein n=1 Tax=Gnomoniopsis smithogilvyi TaxID=1191159 RepID=A0A9W9CY67_9PEZI|nr:hypothetical protein N0V93_002444 [Gnomoniopsis smithogilvyi]
MTRIRSVYMPADGEDDTAPPAYNHTYIHPQTATEPQGAKVEIRPLPDNKGLIVTVEPPLVPQNEKLSHTPCDIVLVIDVSGSMSTEARIPGSSDKESTGLSVLDLVKHACRTILSTLDAGDRLAIITFSNSATEVQELTVMNDANKKTAEENINKIYVQGATNLWAGLRKGIECLSSQANTSRVPAVMLLTDGLPNHMCPPAGYVPALRAMGNIRPTIHTFGFGYQLRSGLLKSIAEFGRGNYSFIPDTGMIGTVFVHAVAHLQSTFAANAVLNLVCPDHITIEQAAGPSVDQHQPQLVGGSHNYHLAIPLGNIQYGQSRDIFLRWKSDAQKEELKVVESIQASLKYELGTNTKYTYCTRHSSASESAYTPAEIAYHVSRHKILAFLASLFPIDPLGEHRACILAAPTRKHVGSGKSGGLRQGENNEGSGDEPLRHKQEELRQLAATLPAAEFPNDPQCASLMHDLVSPEPFGQISMALSKQEYFERWGQHYLPSIHGAHARQLCNSFKDPGPLQYGVKSSLFIKCRNALDKAFDDLPPPAPSILPNHQLFTRAIGQSSTQSMYTMMGGSSAMAPDGGDLLRSQAYTTMHSGRSLRLTASMRDWNNPSGPCFAGRTLVTLAKGTKIRISALRKGMVVATPLGPRIVAVVLVTPVRRVDMVKLQGVLVTPWHPVALLCGAGDSDDSSGWLFPCHASRDRVNYTGCIYSVLLQEDPNIDAHAILLGGGSRGMPLWGVTLGHGLLTGPDVRAHHFFGDYRRVVNNIKRLQITSGERIVTGGTKRSPKTGLVCGFEAYTCKKGVRG